MGQGTRIEIPEHELFLGPDFSFSFSLPSPQGAAYQKVYTVKHRGKCLDRMEKICADWKGRFVSGVSISYGVASTEEFSDLDSLLKAADLRMYE